MDFTKVLMSLTDSSVHHLLDYYYQVRLWYDIYGFKFLFLCLFGSRNVWCMLRATPKSALKAFRKSLSAECNMKALAGTIISLIAMASMSLPSLREVYWLASATWVVSIVSGLLSVHYASNQQNVVSRLHDENEFEDWIFDKKSKYSGRFPVPSFSSVLILSSSKVLLSFALMTYIIGLGVYLGFVWQRNLDVNTDQSDSRNIFIVFLVCLVICYGIYSISSFSSVCKYDCWRKYFNELHDSTKKKDEEKSPSQLTEPGLLQRHQVNHDSSVADADGELEYYANALQAASIRGNYEIVHLLLSAGVDVKIQGGWYGNALQAASAQGHDRIVELLLQTGTDVKAEGGWYGNALQAASAEGHYRIIELLLENGADINAQGGWYGNALRAASVRDHCQIVQLLLNKRAHVNA